MIAREDDRSDTVPWGDAWFAEPAFAPPPSAPAPAGWFNTAVRAFAPPHPALRAVVVIPAKDEAALLPRCLEALARQRGLDGRPLERGVFEVIVLANNCSDDTAALARRFAARRPHCPLHVAEITLPSQVAHVGQARRLLMDAAGARLARAMPFAGRGVILSTDGDSVVAADWLAATLDEIDAGADAVGGRILCEAEPRDGGTPPDRALQRWQRLDAIHRLLRIRLACLLDPDPADPWPRHHQHFGASLAVTARAYAQVGGLPAVRYLEDEALYGRLTRAGLCVRHSPRVRVYTSCRRDGRVEVGLSWQLRVWADHAAANPEMRVETAADLVLMARSRRWLRERWRARPGSAAPPRGLSPLAGDLGVPARWLREAWRTAGNFSQLWADIEACRDALGTRRAARQVPVRVAIDELKRLIARQLVVAPHRKAERQVAQATAGLPVS